MIDLKELRIGNVIEIDYYPAIHKVEKHILTLEDFTPKMIEGGYVKRCNYVKITPELLFKLGFKEYLLKDKSYSYKDEMIYLRYFGEELLLVNVHDEIISNFEIKYLHTLQNMFYLITEKELLDVVAYNYYVSLVKSGSYKNYVQFEKFIEFVNNKQDSVIENYKFGNLPPNLFI